MEAFPPRADLFTGPPNLMRTGLLRRLMEGVPGVFELDLIIPCLHYHDLLAETLPYTLLALADFPGRRLIVTHHDDWQTATLARAFGVECLATDAWVRDGAACNKGAALNAALEQLDGDRWALSLDADIALHPDLTSHLPLLATDERCLYGCDRFMITSPAAWDDCRLNHFAVVNDGHNLRAGGWQMDSRSVTPKDGYFPRGYFQLWHPASGVYSYPDAIPDCDQSDLTFAAYFARDRRVFMPSMLCYHLEPDALPQGTNWRGRKSAAFRPL